MTRSRYLAPILVLALALPSFGYEISLQDGYGETLLGDPLNQSGTRRTESSAPVELRVNLLQVDDTNLDGASDSSSVLADADRSRFARLVDASAAYWEQVPSSSIAVRLAGNDQTSTYVNLRPYVLMTLGRVPSGIAGASWGRSTNGQFFPLGIIINIEYFRQVSDAVILSTIVHEIGHSLAIQHSSCDRYLTQNARFSYTDSLGAFMSYGDAVGRPVLHSDDVAAIAHAYPVAAAQPQFGSVDGTLVDASGQPIFGGNVFAVDDQNRAVVSRLSGLANFRSLSARGGFFRLTGLAPGSYTIVAAPVDSPVYRIGSLPALPFDSYYQRGFTPAVRASVVVRGGETASLGNVVSGSENTLPPPSTGLTWNAVAGASHYLVYLYSYARSAWIVSGQRTATNSFAIELAEGRYYLYAYAYVNGSYVVAASRVVRAGDRPPVISGSASVSGNALQPVTISYSATDPLGGPVRVRASGMPAGMALYSNSLYWASAAQGQYSIRLDATNEVGQTASFTIALSVAPAPGGLVTFQWSRQAYDQYYQVRVYNYARKAWIVNQYVTQNSFAARLEAGSHYVEVRRRIYYRSRWSWAMVGTRTFSVSGDAVIRLP